MTAEVVAQVNHLGRRETSLLTFQNRSDKEMGKGNMLNCIHNNSNTGENPDVVDDITGVIQPYKEYVDKWTWEFQKTWLKLKFKVVMVTSIKTS